MLRVRADHEGRYADAVAVAVDRRRHDMVVEAAPVVPGQEDGAARPIGALHHGIDQARDPRLTGRDEIRRVFAVGVVRDDPRNRGQRARLGVGEESRRGPDVPELAVLVHRHEVGQRVPQAAGACALRLRCTRHLALVAVRLRPLANVVAPGDVVVVEQVGEVCPRVRRMDPAELAGARHRICRIGAER